MIILWSSWIPAAVAIPQMRPFPDITFYEFSQFINKTFDSNISLATVLVLLFTLTSNPELLNLHARQQHPQFRGENRSLASGWIKALARGLLHRLQNDGKKLYKKHEYTHNQDSQVTQLGRKLNDFAILLNLTPYDENGKYLGKLLPTSNDAIKPLHAICPITAVCMDSRCQKRGLQQATRTKDIPLVTLIKGNDVYQDVPVLTGKCSKCSTIYRADRERFKEDEQKKRCYLNGAQFLKVGQSTWVDRSFSCAVLNGMYNFHASAAAYTQFWNDNISIIEPKFRLTRRIIWQTFIQESLWTVASASNLNLELIDGLKIEEVTTEAFELLGNKGIIQEGLQHSCSECSQPYKATADVIEDGTDDPAAVVGADEHNTVPVLTGEDAAVSAQETLQARQDARERRTRQQDNSHDAMDIDYADTTMIILDGLVMSPKHCAFDGCTNGLTSARGGVFCEEHNHIYGARCRIRGCETQKVKDTEACQRHQAEWRKYKQNHSHSSLAGVRRILQRPNESQPWQPALQRTVQAHDNDDAPEIPRPHYFSPGKFYCVETICAPCGVVIAWTKYDKSESPTNILNWLAEVYPTESSRPNYICIDKACKVLRTAIANRSWVEWSKTTRFVVDSYHYINHRTTDYLCRKWCNPAPLNGSAPNLVVVETDKKGKKQYKRAFNTQACEQLNAWLGGYDSILKHMKIGNFDWFLHVMLFYHTQHVLQKIAEKEEKRQKGDELIDDDDSDDEDDDRDRDDEGENVQHWVVHDDGDDN